MADEVPAGRFESVLDAVERAATEILDEAEAEADRRVADAEARAERIAKEKAEEVTRLTDTMLAHAKTVNQRADELLSAIDAAMRELGETSSMPTAGSRATSSGASTTPARPVEASSRPARPLAAAGQAPASPRAETPSAPEESASEREPLRALRERFNQLGAPPRKLSRSAPPEKEEAEAPAPTPSEPAQSRPKAPGKGQASEGAVLLATQMAVAGGSREQIEERLRNDFGIDDPGEILDGLTG